MKINTQYITDNNTYANNNPLYIVIHNTDNYNATADAFAHAKAQNAGHLSGMSAHVYVDDHSAYQAAPFDRGCWHVGRNYGGRLYGVVTNRNSIGIEMCVNAGYDYEKAFLNTVDVCRQLMAQFKIPADRVLQHFDVCAKNCPSAIRARGDWARFKQLISNGTVAVPEESRNTFNRTNSGTCTGNSVRVRTGPDTSYDIVYKLNKGNRFDVDDQVSNGWYRIHIKNGSVDIIGWMYGDYVELDPEPVKEDRYYRVRKSWNDAASQIGAYTYLENAKLACVKGYTVYDWNGTAVYANV